MLSSIIAGSVIGAPVAVAAWYSIWRAHRADERQAAKESAEAAAAALDKAVAEALEKQRLLDRIRQLEEGDAHER